MYGSARVDLPRKGRVLRRKILFRVGRHLHLFEDDMLPNDGVVLLQLELALLSTLVLRRVIREAGSGGRDETDVVAHGTGAVSCPLGLGNEKCAVRSRKTPPSASFSLTLREVRG